jgi:O-antigen/teichoic acid export membrane protein
MNLTRQSLWLTSGRMAASLARLAVNLLIARLFAERLELTAEYMKVWLVFNTTYMIFLFGLPASIYYFHPRLVERERDAFLAQSATLMLLFGLIYAAFLWSVAPAAARFYGCPAIVEHLGVFAVYGLTMIASAFLEPVLNLLGRLRLLAGWMAAEALLFVLAAVGPVALDRAGGLPASWLALVSARAPGLEPGQVAIHLSFWLITGLALLKWLLALLLVFGRRAGPWRRPWISLSSVRDQLAYALPITATTVVAYLAMYLDKNVVAQHFDEGGVYAVFQAGAMEVPLVSVLVGSLSAVTLPHLSRLQHGGRVDEICGLLSRTVEQAAWVVFPLFTLLFVLADPLYIAVWGPDYAGSALPFRLYLLIFPLRLLFYGQVLNTLGRARWVLLTAAGDLALNAALSLLLVRWLGMPGPALATVLATLVEILVFMLLLKSTLRRPLSAIFDPRRLGRIASWSLGAGLAALAGRLALQGSAWGMLAAGTLLHGLYFGGRLWVSGEGRRLWASLRRS